MRERRYCVANCGCRRLRGAFCKGLYKFPKWLRNAYRVSTKIRLEASGFTRVTDRKEMRSVAARPRFVIVAAHHALRLLDARIRRIFGRRVERRFLDVWPRRSVVVRGGAAAQRGSLADARKHYVVAATPSKRLRLYDSVCSMALRPEPSAHRRPRYRPTR